MRLIDADALAAHMFHGYGTEVTPVDIDAETYKLGWNDAIDAIMENAPTIEPERKTGKWIKLDAHAHLADHKCSACGQECYVPTCMGDPMYDFCPNCGARMLKEGEEHD